MLGRKRPLRQQLLEPSDDALVDDLVHPRLDLGLLAVADRLDQQLAQRGVGERGAEHVEHLAAVRLALLLDLAEQPAKTSPSRVLSATRFHRRQTSLLADAVDAAEALLDPVRVPRQVVVDHQVGRLQVQTLAGGVGGEQDLAVGVLGELLGDRAAVRAADPAVDGHDRLGPAERDPDPLREVVERVAVLGEDDELAGLAVAVRAG